MSMVHLIKCQIIMVNLTKGQIRMINLSKVPYPFNMAKLIMLWVSLGPSRACWACHLAFEGRRVGYGLDHHSHACVSVCCCCGDCQTSSQNRDVQPAKLCGEEGRLQLSMLASELQSMGVGLCGLQELRWKRAGECDIVPSSVRGTKGEGAWKLVW